MPVMMTDTSTMEEKMIEMERKLAFLTRTLEDRDVKIATLMNKLELEHLPGFTLKGENAKVNKGKGVEDASQHGHSTSIASLSVQQLQDMITKKVLYGGSSTSSLIYSKPYTKLIDNMRMTNGYQPPKFQKFDRKGNLKQHIAHFVETCENAGTQGSLLVKQFVRLLKGNAFDWYTDLEPESIDSWEQLKREFLNQFYCTRRTVNMMEVTNIKQWKNEPIVDYINRWRSLSLDYKDRLFEISVVEMTIDLTTNDMGLEFRYVLGKVLGTQDRPTLRLTSHHCVLCLNLDKIIVITLSLGNGAPSRKEYKMQCLHRAHDMKLSISSHGNMKRPKHEERKERREIKKNDRNAKSNVKDLINNNFALEMGKLDDPNYCKYHRIISHPIQKFFVLKELIMKLAKERKTDLDFDDVVESNLAIVAYSSLEPVQIWLSQETSDCNSYDDKRKFCQNDSAEAIHAVFCYDILDKEEDTNHGSKLQNRPLYVFGYAREQKIDHILINGGSAINILPKMTMRWLGLTMEDLSHSRLVIQGFNQGGQRIIGMIYLELIIKELASNILFHVIDAKTTYNILLGRPWIHRNKIVPSTLHQCLKYLQGGIKKVNADLKPFTELEAHFADAKLYVEDDVPNEVLLVEILFMGSK
ncbi:hypothetical protein ACB092_06G109700 [Castanea dentata]